MKKIKSSDYTYYCDECGEEIPENELLTEKHDYYTENHYHKKCATKLGEIVVPNRRIPKNIPTKDFQKILETYGKNRLFMIQWGTMLRYNPGDWLVMEVPREDEAFAQIYSSKTEAENEMSSIMLEGYSAYEDDYIIYHNGKFHNWETKFIIT